MQAGTPTSSLIKAGPALGNPGANTPVYPKLVMNMQVRSTLPQLKAT
jgi:hypothetical protein